MKKLYVGNLPYQLTEEELQNFFAEHGIQTDTVTLIRDRQTNQARGFGFVEIGNDEEAERAIQAINGQPLGGRNLVVNEARPPSGGGRGFGGGGGGGGRPGGRGGRGGRGGGGGRGDSGGGRGDSGGGRDRYEW